MSNLTVGGADGSAPVVRLRPTAESSQTRPVERPPQLLPEAPSAPHRGPEGARFGLQADLLDGLQPKVGDATRLCNERLGDLLDAVAQKIGTDMELPEVLAAAAAAVIDDERRKHALLVGHRNTLVGA